MGYKETVPSMLGKSSFVNIKETSRGIKGNSSQYVRKQLFCKHKGNISWDIRKQFPVSYETLRKSSLDIMKTVFE